MFDCESFRYWLSCINVADVLWRRPISRRSIQSDKVPLVC